MAKAMDLILDIVSLHGTHNAHIMDSLLLTISGVITETHMASQ